MWFKADGFKDLIRSQWACYGVSGSSSHCLSVKLKVLKKNIKMWNKEVFGNGLSNKAKTLSHISFWDSND